MAESKMKIALDYDGTYTVDPFFWDTVLSLAKHHGHEIWFVTMRYDLGSERLPERLENPVIYTGRKAKKKFCEDKGMHFDIWIDDTPEWLFKDG